MGAHDESVIRDDRSGKLGKTSHHGSCSRSKGHSHEPASGAAGKPDGGAALLVDACHGSAEQCPADTQIGYYITHQQGGHELLGPIVNVTPEAGQSAEFALENTVKVQTPLLTAHLVRTSQGYGFTVASSAFRPSVWKLLKRRFGVCRQIRVITRCAGDFADVPIPVPRTRSNVKVETNLRGSLRFRS